MAARSDSVGPDSVLEEELDVLRAIYIHELVVEEPQDNGSPTVVFLTLHPATGDDVTQQFVCMTVVFKLPNTYPDDLPEITIKNPRGLAEEEVQRLQGDMIQLAEERCGGAMLFELIEMAKEILTEGNIPRCPCVVCMEHFHEGDLFTRTECYHYFHQACLKRYIEHALTLEPEVKVRHLNQEEEEEPKVVCPVCREEITFDLEELEQAPPLDDENLVYKPSETMIKMQREMAEHYARQKAVGGIIDLEAEKNKYLVNEETVVVMTQDVKSEEKTQKKTDEKKRNPHQNDAVVAKYKGPPRRNQPNSSNQGRNGPYEAKDHPKGDNCSQGRNERQETDRYRGINRYGDRSRRPGTDRYQQDHRRGNWDRRSGGKHAFDHKEMREEVDKIHQHSRGKQGRQDYQRHHERNTNNSSTNENEDNPESVELSKSQDSLSKGAKTEETSQTGKQGRSIESPEDWENERTVVSSPDKHIQKEELLIGDKIQRDCETKASKNYNDRQTSGTKQVSEKNIPVEEMYRKNERDDRRSEKSHSQRGRRDWGRGGRERRDGFQSHRQRERHGERPQSQSSENWDEEKVAYDKSSKERRSGRRDGRNYQISSKCENLNENKLENERKGSNSYRGKSTDTHKEAKTENLEDESIPVEDRVQDTRRDRGHGRGRRGQGRGGRGRRSDMRWQEGDKANETSEDMNTRKASENNRRNRRTNYKRQNENSSFALNGDKKNSNSERNTNSSHIASDVRPPPGFKAPQIEVKAQPSSKKPSPPGIKVPPPDHSTQAASSTSSSPGVRITGPPPGFNSKSQSQSSTSGVSPPPGFR